MKKILACEYVKDAVFKLFRLAKVSVETTSLEVTNGKRMNETKKEGTLDAVEKLSTASTRGSEFRTHRSNNRSHK